MGLRGSGCVCWRHGHSFKLRWMAVSLVFLVCKWGIIFAGSEMSNSWSSCCNSSLPKYVYTILFPEPQEMTRSSVIMTNLGLVTRAVLRQGNYKPLRTSWTPVPLWLTREPLAPYGACTILSRPQFDTVRTQQSFHVATIPPQCFKPKYRSRDWPGSPVQKASAMVM